MIKTISKSRTPFWIMCFRTRVAFWEDIVFSCSLGDGKGSNLLCKLG